MSIYKPHYIAILEKAKSIIATPDRWCREDLARDIRGIEVSPHNSMAVCWCAYGAMKCAGRRLGLDHFINSSVNIFNSVSSKDMIYLNDHDDTTHDMLMETFDRAIAKARGL